MTAYIWVVISFVWIFCRVDTFDIDCDFVGPVDRVTVEHDNSGAGPAWFLDKIVIDDLPHKKKYEFPCGRWLDKGKDDGKIARDLSLGGAFDLDFGGDIDVKAPEVEVELKAPKVKKPKKKFSFGSKDKKKAKVAKKKEDEESDDEGRRRGFDIHLPSVSMPSFSMKGKHKEPKVKAGADVDVDGHLEKPGM